MPQQQRRVVVAEHTGADIFVPSHKDRWAKYSNAVVF